jgi:hypothetical protein
MRCLLVSYLVGSLFLCSANCLQGLERNEVLTNVPSSEAIVVSCLIRADSAKSDFIKIRRSFANRIKKYDSYSTRVSIVGFSTELIGLGVAARFKGSNNSNASLITWGVSSGLPLSLKMFEKFGCKWEKNKETYHNLYIETSILIRRIDHEMFMIRNTAPTDTERSIKLLSMIENDWKEIVSNIPPEILNEDDIKDLKLSDKTRLLIVPPDFIRKKTTNIKMK